MIDDFFILDFWDEESVGGESQNGFGLFFDGANAVAANGGNPVGLFTPNPYEEGSSVSHIDDDNPAFMGLLMLAATEEGPAARMYSPIEVGILTDLGYDVIPEPSTGVLLGLGLLGLAARGRRR